MRLFHVSHLAVLLVSSLLYTADVRLPPTQQIPPMRNPDSVVVLTEEMVYVCDSDVDCIVLSSPKNSLKITASKGPITVRGRFVDSPTKIETREFKGPFIWFIEPAEEGKCELLVVPNGGKESDVLRRTIVCQLGPRPPPIPDPQPKPPAVGVFNEPGLHVLVIFDKRVDLSPAQNGILYGETTRNWLEKNTVLGPDGKTKEYRIWPSGDDVSGAPKMWQEAYGVQRTSLPWVVVGSKERGTYSGVLPADSTEFIKLCEKYKP